MKPDKPINHLEQRNIRLSASTQYTPRTPPRQQTWQQPLSEVHSAPDSAPPTPGNHQKHASKTTTVENCPPSVEMEDSSYGHEETAPDGGVVIRSAVGLACTNNYR